MGSAARTLRQSPPSRPLPALQQRGSALRSLAPFFSSAIFPLQSIAGNRMWVTQQHCLRLRKLLPPLPKGSGGARGRRCGCRGRGGAGGARGGGRSCSPSHVPEHRGSGRGLSQPPEVSGERGGGSSPRSAGTETKRARQTSPQSLGSSRGARSGSWQCSWCGEGTRGRSGPGQGGKGPRGDPCFPGGVPGRCLGSLLPSPGRFRRRRCRGAPTACAQGPLRRVPPATARRGTGDRRAVAHPAPSQVQPQHPFCKSPRNPSAPWRGALPEPPPPRPRCHGQADAAVPRMSVWELRALTFPSACAHGEAEGLKAVRCTPREPRGECGFLPPQTPGKPGGGHAGHPLPWPCLAAGSTARRDAGRRLLPA